MIPADSTLDNAIELLALNRATWAPVVAADRSLVGTTTSEDLMRRYTRLVHAGMRRLDALAGRGVLFDGRVTAGSDLVGKSVATIAWPPGTLVLSVRRDGETLFAAPGTQLRHADEPVIVSRPESMEELDRLLGKLPEDASQTGEPML